MRKRNISILLKIVAITSSIYGIIKTYFGIISFTYFTTLSNLFISFVLLVFFIKRYMRSNDKEKSSFK